MSLQGLTGGVGFASFPSPKPNLGTNTGDATATAANILSGKTAYAVGVKVTGTMPNNSGANVYAPGATIPQGYQDGTSTAVAPVNAILESYVIDAGSAAISVGGLVEFLTANGKVTASTTRTVYASGADVNYFSSTNSTPYAVAIDSTHALLVYVGTSTFGNAVVVTISGSTISYGTPLVFISSAISLPKVVVLTSTTFLVAYIQGTTGKSVVLTVSGTTVTAGTAVSFAASGTPSFVSATALSATAVMVCWCDATNAKAIILSVSGTTITANTSVVFNAVVSPYYVFVSALSATAAIVHYVNDTTNHYPTAQVLSVSGTTITGNTAFTIVSSASGGYGHIIALSSTSALVLFLTAANLNFAEVLTISGTTISGGTSVSIFSASVGNPLFGIKTSATNVLVMVENNQYPLIGSLSINGSVITPGPVASLWSTVAYSAGQIPTIANLSTGRNFTAYSGSTAGVGSYVTDTPIPTGEAAQAGTAGQTINVYRYA